MNDFLLFSLYCSTEELQFDQSFNVALMSTLSVVTLDII